MIDLTQLTIEQLQQLQADLTQEASRRAATQLEAADSIGGLARFDQEFGTPLATIFDAVVVPAMEHTPGAAGAAERAP